MAATIQPIQLVSSVGAWQDAFTWHYKEAASQSFLAGTPLYFVGALMTTFNADNAVWAGVSMAAATGTTSADCPVILPLPGTIFRITVDAYSSATAAAGTGKPSDLAVGTAYAISKDTTANLWYARASGGNTSVIYLGTDPSQNSLVNGWGYFMVAPSKTAYTI